VLLRLDRCKHPSEEHDKLSCGWFVDAVAFFAVHDDKLVRCGSVDTCSALVDRETMFVITVV
jgi:hypothetical protein